MLHDQPTTGCVVVGTGAGALHVLLFSGHQPVPGAVLHTCTLPAPPGYPGAPHRTAGAITSIAVLPGSQTVVQAALDPTSASNTHHDSALARRWLLGTDTSTVLEASWDAASNRLHAERCSQAHRSAITSVAFPADLSKVVAVACFGHVCLWRLEPLQVVTSIHVAGVQALCVRFNLVRSMRRSTMYDRLNANMSQEGSAVLSGWADGCIRAHGPEVGHVLKSPCNQSSTSLNRAGVCCGAFKTRTPKALRCWCHWRAGSSVGGQTEPSGGGSWARMAPAPCARPSRCLFSAV